MVSTNIFPTLTPPKVLQHCSVPDMPLSHYRWDCWICCTQDPSFRRGEKVSNKCPLTSKVTMLILSLIDHESFLSFGVALTFFTLGVVGILGSDDILCCFIVGNSFTWDDWFRVQTEDHAFQDVIDQLLSSVCWPIFILLTI